MAATYYLDSSVSSSGNGQSWATAWKNFSNVTGLQAGDTVYVSGGSTTQAYSLSNWTPIGGSLGNPITYATGQDPGHNGVVAITSTNFLSGNFNYVTINGNVGGAQNWQVTASNYLWEGAGGTNHGVTLEYINFANAAAGFHWSADSNTNLVIEHCRIIKNNDSSNIHDFIFYGGGGTALGAISVHDNVINFPYSSSDHSIGDDMWIWPNNTDFYNNTVQGIPRSYTWTQHSDVFQANTEQNVRVWSNIIIDPGESVYYEDSQTAGTVSNVLIYNNLIVRSFPCNGGAQRIFDLLPENGGANTTAYVDVVVANNTIIDQFSPCIFTARVASVGSLTRVYMTNILQYPVDATMSLQSGVISSNNYAGNAAQLVSYTQFGGTNNDLHLLGTDTVARNQGRDMSAYFTTDKDGVTRPQQAVWDIGAYEFAAAGAPAPPTNLTATPQ